MAFEDQLALEDAYVMRTFGRKPVQFTEGAGMELVDSAGKRYLDFLSGIGVTSLGHCHPALVEAVSAQAAKLVHVSNYYYIEQRGEVAKLLSDLLNDGIVAGEGEAWRTFFANSGAEANECAIKVARLHARKQALAQGRPADEAPRTIVVLERSFHGRTLATLAATAQPVKQEIFQPLPSGFVATAANDVAALERLFEERGGEICAIMVECIQGESGVHPCTPEFLGAARRLTRDRGALLICDEVQTGIFRTGRPFAFQRYGIMPDVVSMAKGIASGFPMGACAARGVAGEVLEPGTHGSTFGGSNLAIAAAHATLSTLVQGGFAEHVEETGAYLRERLATIPQVMEVRGAGLMVGAELSPEAPSAPEAVGAALEAGFVLNATGPATLRFLPPLICEKRHVDALVGALARILA